MWRCPVCNQKMEADAPSCTHCGAMRPELQGGRTADAPHAIEPEEPRTLRAILFGLVAAVIGAVVWYGAVVITDRLFGILSVAIGLLVAAAVVWGAGGKRGPRYQVIAVVCILLSMAFGQYLILRHFIVKQFASGGVTKVPLLLPARVILELLWISIREQPSTLVFWGIALFEGVTLPGRRKSPLPQPSKENGGDASLPGDGQAGESSSEPKV